MKKGSHVLEKMLWCFLILPGIIYSTWRLITKENVCPTCSSFAVFPINSIPGQKLFEEIHSNRNTRFVRRVLTYGQDDFMRDRYSDREVHYHVRERWFLDDSCSTSRFQKTGNLLVDYSKINLPSQVIPFHYYWTVECFYNEVNDIITIKSRILVHKTNWAVGNLNTSQKKANIIQ